MYLYNLSNSPVLISEGPPSIYLDYPCRPAASFLRLLLQAGCVRVRGFLLVSPAPGPPPRGGPLSQGHPCAETAELSKGEQAVHPVPQGP